jgi:protein involved in polysaccharide export with SLBB domain
MSMNSCGWKAIVFPGLALAGLLLAGCQSEQHFATIPDMDTPQPAQTGVATAAPPAATAPGAPATLEGPPGRDELHVNEVVIVIFTDTPVPMMPIEQRIRDDGKVLLPQNQTFVFAGKKIGQLQQEIRDIYVPRYFKTMTVTVQKKPDTQFYYVGGEVKQPGRQVYITSVTVLGAIKSAGDFTDFGRKTKVQIRRADGRVVYIDCKAALKNPKLDLEIYPSDVINVPRKSPWAL